MQEQKETQSNMRGICLPCFMSLNQDCNVCAYRPKHFRSAVATCANREAIFINGEVEKKWWKNNPIALTDRIHPMDQERSDWRVFDPQDCIG